MAESKKTEVEVDGRALYLTNLDKVLYPKTGFTKGQVIDYYANIAEVMLPHLRNRPITLKRYPNGVDASHFFEKNCPSHRPHWVETIPMETEANGGQTTFCAVDEKATLVWMANLAALELHPNSQTTNDLNRPTVMVFDLDPGAPADLIQCAGVALRLREMLADLGLQCFPKSSGSKGMQVYVPLNTKVSFADTAAFAKATGQLLEKQTPEAVLTDMTRAKRGGKVFVDWSQNNYIKTTVAPYSLRAKEAPFVSTPLLWDEVEEIVKKEDASLGFFEADEVLARVDKEGDLFKEVLEMKQKLPEFQT